MGGFSTKMGWPPRRPADAMNQAPHVSALGECNGIGSRWLIMGLIMLAVLSVGNGVGNVAEELVLFETQLVVLVLKSVLLDMGSVLVMGLVMLGLEPVMLDSVMSTIVLVMLVLLLPV